MNRREFVAFFGGAATVWPFDTRGQPPAMPVVGFLHVVAPNSLPRFVDAFRAGLGEAGYVEGRNLRIEFRGRMVTLNGFRRWPPICSASVWM